MPPLRLLLMPQRLLEEVAFWHRLDMKIGVELGVPPPDIHLKDMGQRVYWGPALELENGRPALVAPEGRANGGGGERQAGARR